MTGIKFKAEYNLVFAIVFCLMSTGCAKSNDGGTTPITPPPPPPPPVMPTGISYWLTTGDRTNLLSKQTTALPFDMVSNALPDINVDSTQKFQTVEGFGYTLTQGSAAVIYSLSASDRTS